MRACCDHQFKDCQENTVLMCRFGGNFTQHDDSSTATDSSMKRQRKQKPRMLKLTTMRPKNDKIKLSPFALRSEQSQQYSISKQMKKNMADNHPSECQTNNEIAHKIGEALPKLEMIRQTSGLEVYEGRNTISMLYQSELFM